MPTSAEISQWISQGQQSLGLPAAFQNAMVGLTYGPQTPLGLQAIQNIGPAALGGLISPQTPVLGAITQGAIGRAQAMQAIGQVTFPGGGGPLGMGFGSGQREQIYQAMRQQQIIPQATMGELSQIVGAGAQMGSFTAVHSVQQFKQQFSELLQAVKTVTSTLGVALSDAASMLQQVGTMGFSGKAGAGFLTNLQAAAYSAGVSPVAMMQFMAPMSQVMRQTGGTGVKQGALASQRFLQMMGTGYEMGIINDESLLQATGQAGGAGIMALGQQYLPRAAQRMRHTGRGAYLTAALLDPTTGGIDPEMLGALQGGMMGPEMVQREGGRRANQYGQLDWTVNRNRLAGQVMEQTGGLGELMFYRNYLQQKKTDVGSSRGQVMLSRLSGMSLDEVAGITPLIEKLDEIRMTDQVREAQSRVASARGQRISEGATPEWLKGFKDKLKSFTGKLEDVGAGVQQTLEQMMIDQFNKRFDIVESWVSPEMVRMSMAPGGAARVSGMAGMMGRFSGGGGGGGTGPLGAMSGLGGRNVQERQSIAMMQMAQGAGASTFLMGSAENRPRGMSLGQFAAGQSMAAGGAQAGAMFGPNWGGQAGLTRELQGIDAAAVGMGRFMSPEMMKQQAVVSELLRSGAANITGETQDILYGQTGQRALSAVNASGGGLSSMLRQGGVETLAARSYTVQIGDQTVSVSGNLPAVREAIRTGDAQKVRVALEREAAKQVTTPEMIRKLQLGGEAEALAKRFGGVSGEMTPSDTRRIMQGAAQAAGMDVSRLSAFARTNQSLIGRMSGIPETAEQMDKWLKQDINTQIGKARKTLGNGASDYTVFVEMMAEKFPNLSPSEITGMADQIGLSRDLGTVSNDKIRNAMNAVGMIGGVGALLNQQETTQIYKEMFGGGRDPVTGDKLDGKKVADRVRGMSGMSGLASAIEGIGAAADFGSVSRLVSEVFKGGDSKEISRRLGVLTVQGYDTRTLYAISSSAQHAVSTLGGGTGTREGSVNDRKKKLLQALATSGVDTSALAEASTEEVARFAESRLGSQAGDILGYLKGGKAGGKWTREERLQQFGTLAVGQAVAGEEEKRKETEAKEADLQKQADRYAKANRAALEGMTVTTTSPTTPPSTPTPPAEPANPAAPTGTG